MRRILCVSVVLAALSGPATAGMNEGVAAVTVGDYQKAIAEFTPLAASGDPAAQYQLAKIYLEGRGPSDGVSQGIELMTKAANANHPEAQAQLGLMYAMGLGVQVDNAKAYDWLSKAVTALPPGTRRTVAEANRDAVLKRMSASQQTQLAATSKPTAVETPVAAAATTAAKPAVTQEAATEGAAKKPASEPSTAKATTPTPTATTAKAPTTTKTVTEAAATNKTTSAPAKAPETTAETTTQVASAKAPDAAPGGDATKAPSGVRIQLVSMPSEDAAWSAWKQLSGKYASQLTGLTAMVEPADLGAKGTFYRVQTGPFDTVAAAQERCTAMKEAGLDCLVVGKP